MKRYIPLIALAALGTMAACRGGEVLIDKAEDTKKYENLPTFPDIPDSTKLKISTAGPWAISIAKGGDWCTVSAKKGNAKTDSVVTVYVAENPTASERQTSLILSSGTSNVVYKVVQKAGQEWYETDYWHRTDLQRNGIRGKVKSIQEIQVGTYTATYNFDEKGNLTYMDYAAKAEEGKGYVHSYSITRKFDEAGHLVRYEKTSETDTTTIDYEYANEGKLVAPSLYLPVGMSFEDLELINGIVPDLSAYHKVITTARMQSVSDSKFTFEGSKLLNERNIQMIVEGVAIVDTHDTVSWEYRNGRPYSSGIVTNVVYAENGMFTVLDYMGYRYRFEENARSLIAVSKEDQGYMERSAGEVITAQYKINENHDWTSAVVTVKGNSKPYDDRYSPFYDHRNNWTTTDWTYYTPAACGQIQQTMTRRIDYYND